MNICKFSKWPNKVPKGLTYLLCTCRRVDRQHYSWIWTLYYFTKQVQVHSWFRSCFDIGVCHDLLTFEKSFKMHKSHCQKWDSNPRLENQTATWTQRLRPLGHPDFMHSTCFKGFKKGVRLRWKIIKASLGWTN